MRSVVDREIRTQLPGIFQVTAELGLVPDSTMIRDVRITIERRILSVLQTKELEDGSDRTGEVEQQILGGSLIGADTGNGCAVESSDRISAGADHNPRIHIGVRVRTRFREAPFSTAFKRMLAMGPAEVVADLFDGTIGLTPDAVPAVNNKGCPFDGDGPDGDSIDDGYVLEKLFSIISRPVRRRPLVVM